MRLLVVLLLLPAPVLAAEYTTTNGATPSDGIAQVEEILLSLVSVVGFGLGVLGGSKR